MNGFSIFKKDWASELRTRYAINALIMFILVTVSVILFSIGEEEVSPYLAGGLLWVVIFFSAMSGLSRGFVSEEERGTVLLLKLIAKPSTVFTGKLLFNLLLVFLMNGVIVLLYMLFFNSFVVENFQLFFLSTILGSLGIGISSTIIASIISKAGAKGTLYPVLSFPVLLPLILILLELTKFSIDGRTIAESYIEILILVCYDIIMLTASYLLFDIIWKD